MVFKKYWSDLHKKHFNTITVNGSNGVVRVSCCRLDHVLKKPCESTNRHHNNTFFSKINSNAKKGLLYSFNWIRMVSKCIVTVPNAF